LSFVSLSRNIISDKRLINWQNFTRVRFQLKFAVIIRHWAFEFHHFQAIAVFCVIKKLALYLVSASRIRYERWELEEIMQRSNVHDKIKCKISTV